MDASEKCYDEKYEFDAPQFIDFSNFRDEDIDDTFFDCPDAKNRSLQDVRFKPENQEDDTHMDTSEQPPTTADDVTAIATENVAAIATENVAAIDTDDAIDTKNVAVACDSVVAPLESVAVEPAETSESVPTAMSLSPMPENENIPVSAASNDTGEAMRTEDTDENQPPVTRSSRKGPLGSDGVFLELPMRHSPRLAAIGKVIVSKSPSRNSPRKGRRRSVSAAPRTRKPRLGGSSGPLTVEERSHLAQMTHLATDTKQQHNSRPGVTKPIEFKFATDSRIKTATASPGPKPPSAADFSKSLRNNAKQASASNNKGPRGPTKVQPFKFSESRKPTDTTDNAGGKFISLAEMNMRFHLQTPQRFRTKPKKGEFQGFSNSKSSSSNSINLCGLTQPKSPALSTLGRNRPVNYPTWDEQEILELEQIRQNKFKCKPVNPKVFEPPKMNALPPKVTQIEPFDLTETQKEKNQQSDMMARLERQIGMSASLVSLPHGGIPTTRSQRTNTKLQPFSFDRRDQHTLQKKNQKIEQIIAKEKGMAEFHAHPMPVFDGGPKGLPVKKPSPATCHAPFNLNVDQRGEIKKTAHERELADRENYERSQREFHARPATVTQQAPFIAAPSSKPLTTITDFMLNTEKRMEQRLQFDMLQKRKEDETAAAKRQKEAQLEEEEERLSAEERKRLVHKAQPMPMFPAPVLAPCELPVTKPLSPKLATSSRLRSSRSKNSVNATFDTTSSSK